MRRLFQHILLLTGCFVQVCVLAQTDRISAAPAGISAGVAPDGDSLVMIADIAISGNKRTKSYIIAREIPFRQGEYLLRSDLEKKLILAQEQVVNTSLFINARVYIASIQGSLVFINVDVKERWYLFPLPYFKLVDRNFNEWWVAEKRNLNRVNYGIKFTQNNVSGRNDNLNIWLINGYNRQVNLSYNQPYADRSLKNGYNLSLVYSSQHELNYSTSFSKQAFSKENDFARTYLQIEASYLYRPAIKTRHTFSIGYIDDRISDSIIKLNPGYFPGNVQRVRYPVFSYTLQYFDVDYIPYPLKGFMGDFSFTKKGVGNALNLWQFETHASYTMPFFAGTHLQFQAGGILSLPFDQPFYTQQILGYGDLYLRGLEYYVADGVATGVGRFTLNKEIFSFTINPVLLGKTHDQIPFRFFLKTYGDIGYTYSKTPGNSLLDNRLLKTWGVGLDIVTVYDVVIKLEYSFNQLGNQGLFIHTRTDF